MSQSWNGAGSVTGSGRTGSRPPRPNPEQWKNAFLSYFDTGRASNSEAINGLIELHRRIARGFRNRGNYPTTHAPHRRRAGSAPTASVKSPQSRRWPRRACRETPQHLGRLSGIGSGIDERGHGDLLVPSDGEVRTGLRFHGCSRARSIRWGRGTHSGVLRVGRR
ncbi:transposase [Tessaracoccus sp. O5.2]|uniref:transposase n=1 Tax=Tessaracoccus sp. O5.2 TaxID=3157622 RepID=UPI0036DC4920